MHQNIYNPENQQSEPPSPPMPQAPNSPDQIPNSVFVPNHPAPVVNMPTGGGPDGPIKKGLKLSHGIKLLLIILLGGLSVIGLAAIIIFGAIIPNKPEVILKNALQNSLSSKSVKFKGNFIITPEGSPLTLNTLIDGQAGVNGAAEIKLNTNFGVFDINFETKTIGDSAYIKLAGIPDVNKIFSAVGFSKVEQKQLTEIVNSINDQWLEIDPTLLSIIGLNNSSRITFSELDIAQIIKAARNNQFVSIKQSFEDEEIDGNKSYHYGVDFQRDKFIEFLGDVSSIKLLDVSLSDEVFKEVLTKFTDSLDVFEEGQLEVWINKSDKTLSQVLVGGEGFGTKFELKISLGSYGEKVEVAEPEEPKSLFKVLNDFYDKFEGDGLFTETLSAFANFQISRRDNERKTEADLISSQLQLYATETKHYPTAKDFKDETWVATNIPGLQLSALVGPNNERYVYFPFDKKRKPCGNVALNCKHFKIIVDLERDGLREKDSDRDKEDYVIAQ